MPQFEESLPPVSGLDPIKNAAKQDLYSHLPDPLASLAQLSVEWMLANTDAIDQHRTVVQDMLDGINVRQGPKEGMYVVSGLYVSQKEMDRFRKIASIPSRLELYLQARDIRNVSANDAERTLSKYAGTKGSTYDNLQALFNAERGTVDEEHVVELGAQAFGGLGTGRTMYQLLAADLYQKLQAQNIPADERPEMAHDLMSTRAFGGALLLISSKMHVSQTNFFMKVNTTSGSLADPSNGMTELTQASSPLIFDGGKLRISTEAIDRYWTSPQMPIAGTEVLGCPARKAVKLEGSDDYISAISILTNGLTELLKVTRAFEVYEARIAA